MAIIPVFPGYDLVNNFLNTLLGPYLMHQSFLEINRLS